MARRYVPARGGVIWITLNPQAGHPQAGRRSFTVIVQRQSRFGYTLSGYEPD